MDGGREGGRKEERKTKGMNKDQRNGKELRMDGRNKIWEKL